MLLVVFIFFFMQKTAYEMRISDLSSDVCSSDLACRRTVDRAVPPLCTASVCSWFAFLLSCCGGIFLRQATGLAQRFTQHVFDLGVEAAQLVVRPALRGGEPVGVAA